MNAELIRAAEQLAAENSEMEPAIETILLFPSDDEIRLVEIDRTMIPSDRVTPFYFPPDPQSGIPFRTAIALIMPSERAKLDLPDGWGRWDDALQLWPRN